MPRVTRHFNLISAIALGSTFAIIATIAITFFWINNWITPERKSTAILSYPIQINRTNDLIDIDAIVSIQGLLEAIQTINKIDQRQIISIQQVRKKDQNVLGTDYDHLVSGMDNLIISTGYNHYPTYADVTTYSLKLENGKWVIKKVSGYVS